jgi:predicted RNA-binding Zn ribbon-like protein
MSQPLRSDPGSVRELRLLGGRVALDFVNTLDPRSGPAPTEFLRSPEDLVAWCAHTGVLEAVEAARVLREVRRHPHRARRVFKAALQVREAMFRTFAAVARRQPPAHADLAIIARAYRGGLERASLRRSGPAYEWVPSAHAKLEEPLWAVARDAMDLLTSPLLKRVRMCPGLNDCGWLFLDETKNGSRRWCSMEGCGNRVKARRQAARRTLARRAASTWSRSQ